jgi:hypothetical protein
LNISFDYPSTWVSVETPMGNHGDLDVVFMVNRPAHQFPMITGAKHSILKGHTDDSISWALSRINSFQRVKIGPMESFATPTVAGKIISSSYQYEPGTINEMDVLCNNYIIVRNSTFLITFCSELKDWKLFEPVIQDFINSLVISGE